MSQEAISAGEVFIVDDDPAIRDVLTAVFSRDGFQVTNFADGASLLASARTRAPVCIILDVHIPGRSGLDILKELNAQDYPAPIFIMSGRGDIAMAVDAIKNGALDFIEKPWEDDTLVNAVRRALDHDRETRTRRDTSDSISRRVSSLTPRETEVFRHVIAGRLNKQIAAKLGTAEKTIKVHRARVMHKMSVRSVAELTRVAEFMGIHPEP
jgi:FixJ family two-component response regulator